MSFAAILDRASMRFTAGSGGAARPVHVAGHARLDERDALRDLLSDLLHDMLRDVPRETARGPLGEPDEPGDLDLVAAAVRRWGADAPARLDGEFAFAAFDAERRVLVCARDRFGVLPLFFHAAPGRLACAGSIPALLALGGVPRRPCERGLARFLAGLPYDPENTALAAIRRLAPGTALACGSERLEVHRFHSLERPAAADRDTVRHAGEAVRERLERAVVARMRGVRAGAMLSGGLDSSAIAVLARDGCGGRALPTMTLDLPSGGPLDERRFAEAVLATGGFAPRFVRPGPDAFGDRAAIARAMGQPTRAYGLSTTAPLYAAARAAGVDAILDGHGGDEVISHGHGRLRELAREARYRTLLRESVPAAVADGMSRMAGMRLALALASSHGPLGRALRPLRGGRRPAPDDGPVRLRASCLGALDGDAPPPPAGADERDLHLAALRDDGMADAFEALDAPARAAGVEPRYPFFDRALVELCLSLPGDAKLAGGWTRLPLRHAMAGRLPDAVRWRRDKVNFLRHFAGGLRAAASTLDEAEREGERLAPFVDLGTIATLRERVVRGDGAPDLGEAAALWRLSTAALWLRDLEGAEDAPPVRERAA